MHPTADKWSELFVNLNQSLHEVFKIMSQDNDANINEQLMGIYSQLHYLVYQMYALSLKHIHILTEKEIAEIKQCRKAGRLLDNGSSLANTISELLALLALLDPDAEKILVSLL